MLKYESLGRTSQEEFENGVNIMDAFIGRKGVFVPKLIIVDKGKYIKTTNRIKLPVYEKMKKSELLEYDVFENDMPLTNPAEIADILDIEYLDSKFNK